MVLLTVSGTEAGCSWGCSAMEGGVAAWAGGVGMGDGATGAALSPLDKVVSEPYAGFKVVVRSSGLEVGVVTGTAKGASEAA